MWLPKFLHNPLQLLIRLEQILVDLVNLFSKFQNLAVGFVDELSSDLKPIFPSLYPLENLLNPLIDLLISLLPLLHFLHFKFSWSIVAAWFGLEPARFRSLKQSLSFLSQGFLLSHDLLLEFA